MVQIIWIFVFAGSITSGISSILHHPHNLKRLFSANNRSIDEQPKLERSFCTNKQCEKLAKMLIGGMNRNADPCDDFYEFACGNWKIHNPMPPNEKYWNTLIKIQRNVEKRLEEILLSEPKPEDLYAVKFSKRAYKACMNTDEMDKAGLQPFISTLWRAGGWPLIMEEEEWDEGIYKWQFIDDYYASIIGLNTFHDLHVDLYGSDIDDVFIIINTPHLPPNMDKLITLEEMDMDSSDENNESGEGSQEKGSEENDGDDNEDNEDEGKDDAYEDEYDEDEGEDDEYEDEYDENEDEKEEKKLTNEKKANKHIKTRTKRGIIKIPRIPFHKPVHVIKQTHKPSKYIPVRRPVGLMTTAVDAHKQQQQQLRPDRIIKFVSYNIPKNSRTYENTNNDLYFSDNNNERENINDDNIDNTNSKQMENINEDQNEENGSGSSTDDNETNEESGSGKGDNDDQKDDEDGGSNDYEDEDGSDSGDYEDEDGSGSGDYEDEDGGGSGAHEDEDSDNDNNSEEERKRMEDMERVKKFRAKYADYILNVSMTLAEARGVPVSKEKLKMDIADLLEFQINLMKLIHLSGEKLELTLESFQKKYDCLVPLTDNGKISWIRKIRNVFASGGMEIDKKDQLVVPSFRYIKHLRKLLDRTPSKTIVNYVHWNFLSKVLKTATKEMRGWYYDLRNEEVTVKKRSDLCIREIKAQHGLGYEYVKKYFSDKIKQTASDMIDNIEKEVEYQIKESTWMGASTKHFIADKLVYLKKLIGYPSSYRNSTIMNQHLKGLSVSRSHYENTLSIMRYYKWDRLKLFFTKEIPAEEIPLDPLKVNAFFISIFNTIEITAADFQSPFFDFDQPWYTNFGAIGYIMAHEVNHGFDNRGRVFNKYGKYMEWLPKMAEAYEKRAECFEHQFTKYSVVDNKTGNIQMKDYGIRTEGENIADSLGLQAAFKAYQRRQRECKEPDPVLPGLEDLSNEQLLFLSFASLWCENMSPDQLQQRILKDRHSLGSLRVIGSVSNSEDFAKSFNCPEGSPMNPKKKCNIWK